MNCPECDARNRPNASFCIECGEPLELNNAPESNRLRTPQPAMAAPAPSSGPLGGTPDRREADELSFPASMLGWLPRPLNPTRWGLEVRITVVILLVAIIADLLLQNSARSDAANYQRGLQAEQQQHWHDAALLLQPLARKNYQEASTHYKSVEQQVEEFDRYENWAQGMKLNGSLVRAALYYKQANQIEPGYDGVDKALTDTLQRAGQLLYQKPGGLYLADATGVPLAALPGSDVRTEVLAVSLDSRFVAYTGFDITAPPTQTVEVLPSGIGGPMQPGQTRPVILSNASGQPTWQAASRKVYIRNLSSGATELFDDVLVDLPGGPEQSTNRAATFVNNNKGLVVDLYRYDDKLSGWVTDLYYFDIAANAGLRKIDTAYSFAQPDSTDTHLYYTPVDNSKLDVRSSIASYDLNIGKSNIIAHSDGNIGYLYLGGKLTATPSTRVLFYTAAQNNRLRIYSKLPPDTSTATMLVDESDITADTDALSTIISVSHNGNEAIAIKHADKEEGWILQPDQGKAISLSDKGWDVVNGPLYTQYSPDDSKVLVQGQVGQGESKTKTWFAVVDSSMQLTLRPGWLPGGSFLQWLNDGKHLYSLTDKGFAVIDAESNNPLAFIASQTVLNRYSDALSLLPDQRTLLYAADDGVYISDVDGQYPIQLIPGATAAWLITANK
jgi:hypothetical protein